MELDIAIIGGGPAGAATALALLNQGNWRVGIFEMSSEPVFRIGESLPPSNQVLLAHLGIFDSFKQEGHLPSLGNCSAWGDDTLAFNDFWTSMGGKGWHLDRSRFDTWLLQTAVERGAMLMRGMQVVGCDRAANGDWNLNVKNQEGNCTQVNTSLVVDASGSRSIFARWQGVRTVRMDNLLALTAVFPLDGTEAFKTDYTLIEAVEFGWWYGARLPGDRVIITLMCDGDIVNQYKLSLLKNWIAALGKTLHVQRLTQGVPESDKLHILPAFSQYLEQTTGENWIAVGDAACKFDPLSSSGIYKALLSGIQAADAIKKLKSGEANALLSYHLETQHQFELYLEDRRQYYSQETRWKSFPFWKRRQGHLSLSPTTVLSFEPSPQATTRLKGLNQHFSTYDLHLLCQLCNSPQPANKVVGEFLARIDRNISAYRPIEALQYLIDQEIIQSVGA
ncbi:MAG: NAD(P)/FAD-dependent oxidoreductase [Okeania sp. SIO3I5]|uniref:NAD(P)/FAD-dependent oxidoreductase n=1 Tax=Okeania sp. SIO3I5 TaxID=2607805 RepID=UPI0013BC8CC8|nr:tryptophan 7-halogenase [Okeania sp. SIO3I5]NEQ41543.1 NAD(P)/FAD-dependent oxidoreductase [Okeania sp. SIO3I5]